MANDYEDDIDMDEDEGIYTDDGDDSSILDLVGQIKDLRDEKKKSPDDKSKEENKDTQSKSSDDKSSNTSADTAKTSKENQTPSIGDAKPDMPSKMDAVASGGKTIGSGLNTLSSAQRTKDALEDGDYVGATMSGLETAKSAKNTIESAQKTAETLKNMKSATDVAKLGSAGGPYVWIAIGIIALVILLIMLVMATTIIFMSSSAAVAATIEEQSNPENMSTNSLITDDYFYGIRTIYVDDTELANSLQLSYKQYAIDIIANIGENNADATITISLPTETITNKTEIDEHITNMSIGIGNIIATGSSQYTNIDFATLYPQIAYFGMTPSQVDSVNTFVTDYIKNNNLIAIEGSTIDALVDNAMNHTDLQYIYNICEKVMIKDEIATADGISGLEQRKYIASIYMPNKNIIITSSSHIVSTDSEGHTNHIKLIEKSSSDDKVYIDEPVGEIPYIQDGASQINRITLGQFNSIDKQNLVAFSNGLSLFDAMKMSPSYNSYFIKNSTTNVYTWRPTDNHYLYLEFEPNSEFIFGEFDLSVLWAD